MKSDDLHDFRHLSLTLICAGIVLSLLSACANRSSLITHSATNSFKTGTVIEFERKVGKVVHFVTDSSQLTEKAKSILTHQVHWLLRYPQYAVTLEGHADERGTRAYNIGLGAKRAETVRRYLTARGVNPTRIRTISYGKERPVALCDNISCWSQNRRVVTILNTRAGS